MGHDSFLLNLSPEMPHTFYQPSFRFLQGPETDAATVRKIREAIDNQTEVTVQLINCTKSGKKFWNLFHLQPMRDQKGEVQYFIGVQLDGSEHIEPLCNSIPEEAAVEGEKSVRQTAENADDAVRELPDANLKPADLWINHSKVVHPKPHRKDSPSWKAIQKNQDRGEPIGLKHFRPIKPLGSGDTGSVHLVELCGTGQYFAMKAMDKGVMLNRNKSIELVRREKFLTCWTPLFFLYYMLHFSECIIHWWNWLQKERKSNASSGETVLPIRDMINQRGFFRMET